MKKQILYEVYISENQGNMDRPAIIIADMDELYTHREFLALVDRAAAGFSSLGLADASRVGIMLNN